MSKSKLQVFNEMSSEKNVEEIIKQLYELPTWYSNVHDWLTFREYTPQDNSDEDLDYLIGCYVNKNSKRVKYAGDRLRKMFLELPPVEQRKVGLALLTGGRTDTEWVCKRLNNYKPKWNKEWEVNWHPCYSHAIEDAWIKYKGISCGRVLILFLDKETVRKHQDELLKEDELYFDFCRRFLHEDWFVFDKERLAKCTSINAYLSILSQTSDGISDEEARKLLYQWIAAISAECKGKYSSFKHERIFWRSGKDEHRVIYAWGIDTAIFYLLRMGKRNVVAEFLKWDETVYNTYISTLNARDFADNQEQFVDVILSCLPDDYKYLGCLNYHYYHYVYSAGQPYVVPRIHQLYKGQESKYKAYLSEPNSAAPVDSLNDASQNVQPSFTSENEFELFVSEHPGIKQLVDELKLSPIIDDSSLGNS